MTKKRKPYPLDESGMPIRTLAEVWEEEGPIFQTIVEPGKPMPFRIVDEKGDTLYTITDIFDYGDDGKLHRKTFYHDKDGRETSKQEFEEWLEQA